ncbi:organic solvent ABC transporter substrate-binding protein [Alsobacter metallidurans]|uniref:Organic solvent ABC transporter substrate-binding protein n=1 Tax=Alsobacter metallidurans TaxID=340221 RepID=A0A917IAJ5_9HYPH|nr:MlaD family protein [Alsobacter metallidurans]GGH26674.1 organic solvent ABC transporter substrate-binding protein [Alsobacter metallidurans]
METRANYALIGLFTLAVLTAAFGFVFWFSGKDAGAKLATYRIVFNGSVSGLSRGAQVLYNGLRVGEVNSIQLAPNDPSKVIARIEIDAATPMNVDTKARLEFQGLTGVASIQLSGGGPDSAKLVQNGAEPPAINADRSDFQDLLESAQRLAKKADDVLGRADQILADNQGSISATVRNIETFSGALASNSEGVNKFLSSTGNAADKIASLSVDLQKLTETVDNVVKAVNPEDVNKVVANLQQITSSVAGEKERIAAFIRDASTLAGRLNDTSVKLDGVLADAGRTLRAVDADKIQRSVDNVEKFTAALGNNSERVDDVIKNAGELTAKLNRAADQVDSVLASVRTFLGSDDTKAALGSIGDMAKSVRVLADNLDKRTSEITAGINRVTGPALRDYQSLASDGKQALGELNRTLRSLQQNPQQLLFGGKPSLPEYRGR